jgi:choline dehydrogenase
MFDVLIAGGGPAGCALAARLSEDPSRSVCLVEAGPCYGTPANWPRELLDPSGIPESHDWADEFGSLPWARVLGGCSAHNACAVTRGPRENYEGWGDGWSWATLEPCLARARAAIGARARAAADIGVWHAAVLEAATGAGLTRLADLDEERPGVAVVATNVVDGRRHNAALAYLPAAGERPNLTIAGQTIVDRVLLEDGVARGVVTANGSALEAQRVVLTAGTYGSPAILLRSGIGPEDELRAHGIPVVHALPGVGAQLADHCRVGAGFALQPEAVEAMQAETGDATIVAQCMAKWRSPLAGDEPWDVHFLAITTPPTGRITTGLLAPRSRGRVRLRSRDPRHLPVVENRFLSDAEGHDRAVLEQALDFARDLGRRCALVTEENDVGGEPATYYHPTGTCALGEVVAADLAVHGLTGLHVADASVIPRPVLAGTYLSTLAVAERAAELLA